MSTDGWTNLYDNNDTSIDYRGHIVLPTSGTRGGGEQGGGIGMDGLNIPSKPSSQGALGANTQAGRRWTVTLFDMHRTGPSGRFPNGRPWTGELELSANPDLKQEPGFVTPELQPGEYVTDDNGNVDRRATFQSVWQAPWTPLPKYFQFNYKARRISFAYARMKTDEQNGMDQYYEAAAKMAAGMNLTTGFEYGEMPPFVITGALGSPTPYIRNIKVVEAAMAGDPWLLGYHDEPNAELAKLLGYNERTGMRMLSYKPEPKPVVTPEQVLATPQVDLMAMIDEMRRQNAAMQTRLDALAAEKARDEKPVRSRGKKSVSSSVPEAPAA